MRSNQRSRRNLHQSPILVVMLQNGYTGTVPGGTFELDFRVCGEDRLMLYRKACQSILVAITVLPRYYEEVDIKFGFTLSAVPYTACQRASGENVNQAGRKGARLVMVASYRVRQCDESSLATL